MDTIIEDKKKIGRPIKYKDIIDENSENRYYKVSVLINKNRYNNDPEYRQKMKDKNALNYQIRKLKKIIIGS